VKKKVVREVIAEVADNPGGYVPDQTLTQPTSQTIFEYGWQAACAEIESRFSKEAKA
jgi:hypothetical protein